MEGEAVQLDHQLRRRPVGVHFEAEDPLVDLRLGQFGVAAEVEKSTLELRTGVGGPGLRGYQPSHGPEAAPAAASPQHFLKRTQVEQLQTLGFLKGPPEASRVKDLGQVEQRTPDACHRDAVALGAIARRQIADVMQRDPWLDCEATATG